MVPYCSLVNFISIRIWLVLMLTLIPRTSSSWWFLPQLRVLALGSSSSPAMCDLIPGLSRGQRRLCRVNPESINAIREGVQLGVSECQRQFVNYRWNCSTIDSRISLKAGSPESAFVYAITSAGVVYAVAKACNREELRKCECDKRWMNGRARDEQGDFIWGGCSDNIPYATNFARKFIDAKDRMSRDARALMNLQNNRAGRKVVRRSAEKRCKCHGVSGSCVTRTCWWSLPKFDVIGRTLHQRYQRSVQVTVGSQGRALVPFADHHAKRRYDHPLGENTNTGNRITPLDLVYFESSPDYCNKDPSIGSAGTAGRRCNRTSNGPDGCDSLCCGRGFHTKRELRIFRCNCRFIYCCDVVCQQCSIWEDVHTCKGEPEFEEYIAAAGSRQRN